MHLILLKSYHHFILTYLILRFQVATASADNSARIWDLRNRKTIYTIPAHNGLVSFIKYESKLSFSNFSISHVMYTCIVVLTVHAITGNHNYLMTASYDKTAKVL